MEETFGFNKFSKRIKVAYLRWRSLFNPPNDMSDRAVFSCMFILFVSNQCNKSNSNSFKEIVNTVWLEVFGQFQSKQNKDLKAAKIFIQNEYINQEKEAKQHLSEIKDKLNQKRESFINDAKAALKLFDFTLDDELLLTENNQKYSELISKLQNNGYKAFLADSIEIIDANPQGIGSKSKKILSEGYDVVTNGTFFGENTIFGTLMTSNGETRESRSASTNTRGCLIIYKSGLVSINYSNSTDPKEICESLKIVYSESMPHIPELTLDDNVSAFISGGVYLIKDSQIVSGKEIFEKQQFKQTLDGSENGLKIEQLRKAKHIIWGIWNYLPFLISAEKPKNGDEIQKELSNLGFSDVVKFDGDSNFFFDSNDLGSSLEGRNSPTGFAVKIAKL